MSGSQVANNNDEPLKDADQVMEEAVEDPSKENGSEAKEHNNVKVVAATPPKRRTGKGLHHVSRGAESAYVTK